MRIFPAVSGREVRLPAHFEPYARDVSDTVFTCVLPVPHVPSELRQAWCNDALLHRLGDPGEVSSLRSGLLGQWSGLQATSQAVIRWLGKLRLRQAAQEIEPSLLACFGAVFHEDSSGFGDQAFVVVWLTEDEGLDLYFPNIGKRVALSHGVSVLFDSCQPHGVVQRGTEIWDPGAWLPRDPQLFLSWDLPLHRRALRNRLGVRLLREEGQTHIALPHVRGQRVQVDPKTGHWYQV